MSSMEEEVIPMPVKDASALRAWLVERGCHSFIRKKLGRVLKATKDQMISMQVWRIPLEKIGFNTLSKRPEETLGVYAKDGNGEIHPGADKS